MHRNGGWETVQLALDSGVGQLSRFPQERVLQHDDGVEAVDEQVAVLGQPPDSEYFLLGS